MPHDAAEMQHLIDGRPLWTSAYLGDRARREQLIELLVELAPTAASETALTGQV